MIERYTGKLYRALNPVFAREPLSGRGAQLHGGRFNARGVPALYASLSILTALREANQVGGLQPTTLVSYDADIQRVFDTRDAARLAAMDMDDDALADPSWRDDMLSGRQSRTQDFARRLATEGWNALLVRSFAPGAVATDLNLVLWHWSDGPPHRLTLVDDEGRLAP